MGESNGKLPIVIIDDGVQPVTINGETRPVDVILASMWLGEQAKQYENKPLGEYYGAIGTYLSEELGFSQGPYSGHVCYQFSKAIHVEARQLEGKSDTAGLPTPDLQDSTG